MSDGASSASDCQTSDCTVTDSNAYLTLNKSSTIYAKQADATVELSGTCYTASVASHVIKLSFTKSAANVSIPYRGLNVGVPGDSSVKCNQGKFNVIIQNLNYFAAGVYTVKGQMTLSDSSGVATSPSSAAFTVSLSLSAN